MLIVLDTDVEESEPRVRPTGAKRPLMYSTSVPISVPTWGSDKVQQYSEDEVRFLEPKI